MGDFNKIWVTHVMWGWQILQVWNIFQKFFSVGLSISYQASVDVCVRKKKKKKKSVINSPVICSPWSDMWFFFTIRFLFGWTLISWMNYEIRDWLPRYRKIMTKILYSFIDLWNFTINRLLILLINKNYLTSNKLIYKLINLISRPFKYDFWQIYI